MIQQMNGCFFKPRQQKDFLMMLPKTTRTLAFGLFCFTASLGVSAAPGPGWTALAQNRNPAAQAAFRAALKSNPSDADALCGLALVQQAEDDEAGGVQTLRRLYAAAPASPQAAALWPQLVTLTDETGRQDLLQSAAADLPALQTAPPFLRASAQLALAQSASRRGLAAEAARQWNALGFVRRWQVIGPFDNASRFGFGKPYPPEQEIALVNAYPGKDDQTLRWHSLGLVNLDGHCAVGQALGDKEANVFYAVTAVQSPRPQAALLEFDPTGASKIGVNGVWVHADPLLRAGATGIADPFSVPVTLRAGWNTILIKLCDDDTSASAFALRVTDANGTALPALPADPAQAKLVPASQKAAADAAAPVPAENAAAALIRRQMPPSLEATLLLGQVLRLDGDYPASAEAFRQGLLLNPNCGLLHWELAQTLKEDKQDDDAKTERNLALAQNPRLVEASLDALADAKETLSAAALVARARTAAAAAPGSPDAQWALARAYDSAELKSETLQTARRAFALAPGTGSLLRLFDFLTDQGRKPEAALLMARALKAAPGDTALLSARADALTDEKNGPAGIAALQKLLALEPAIASYRVRLARLLQEAGKPAAALSALRTAHALRPQNADTETALADALLERKQTKEAVALYQDAVRLDPSAVTLRDKLAVMTGTKPVLDLAPETDAAPLLAAALHLAAPNASAVLLLDEGRTVVYSDFATLTRYHQIIKLLDQSAVERYSEYPLSRITSTSEATVESARVLKADGKVQDVTENAGSSSITFPSLSPGDVLDVSYRVEDYHRGGLARQFWASWNFSVADAPSRLSRFVLIAPPGLALNTQAHGTLPMPTVHDAGGWRIREWRLADVPPRPSEIMAAGPLDTGTWLDISTLTSWSQVVEWYQVLSAPRCVPDAIVRAKAAALTKNAQTDTEKIKALQAYVAQDIEYQSSPFRLSAYVPTEGKDVIRDRYGDCKDKAALLTALLAAVGIKSDMVLLSPRRYGLTSYLPSPRFSHAIARVRTASGPLFVDATAAQLDFGDLPSDDQQVSALVIASDTTALSETPTLPLGTATSEAVYTDTLSADGTLHGTLDWTLAGRLAWQIRLALRQVPEAKHEEMMHSLADYLLKGAVCESDSLDHADDTNLPLSFHFTTHTDHYSTLAGSFLLMPLPWNGESKESSVAALLAEPKRMGELEAASSRARTRSVACIRLPAGYVPEEVPADVHQETPFGAFRTHYEVKDGLLTATRTAELTALRVSAKDVPQYAAFLKAMNDETARQIVLKKQ